MRIALVSLPTTDGRYVNRDLFGGMGIHDDFGTRDSVSFVAYLKAEGTVIPEIALPTLAALLRDHEVRVFDGARVAQASQQGFFDGVARFAPDWIVASTSYAGLYEEVRTLGNLRGATGARVAVFGYAAQWYARDVLGTGHVDLVVAGEPEAVLPDVLAGRDRAETPGLIWIDGSTLRDTGTRLVEDLDALPIPDWHAMPLASYRYFPLLRKRPFATLLSSRGCRHGCAYCPYAVAQGTRFRSMSPARVAAELEALVQRFGVRSVLFRDPSFGLDRARVLALCAAIVERRVRVDWGCETRLDGLDDEVLDALYEAGCRSVEIGLDSLSAPAMRQSGRLSLPLPQVAERLHAMRRRKLDSAGLFVIGLPGDDQATIRRTLDEASRLPLTWINYQIPIPFPGTRMYQEAVERGDMAPVPFERLSGVHPPLAITKGLDLATLRDLQSEGMRRFYVTPRRLVHTLRGEGLGESAAFLGSCAVRFLATRHDRARAREAAP